MRRLTNLSANNRSLFLPRLSNDQFIDLHSLSQLNGENSFSLIEALLDGKKKNICPVTDSRIEASNEASLKLKKLKRADEFIFEERGSHDLHVAWLFAHGKFSDGTFVRAPLLFFPVKLEVDENNWKIVPRKEMEISSNKSFLLGHSYFNKTNLNELLMEETFEDFPSDTIAFRTDLYKLFQRTNIDIHFNPSNYYQNELVKFSSFTKEEFDSSYHNGELKLFPEAVLGIFPQAGSSLVPDYLHLLEETSFQDLEEFFFKSENSLRGTKNFIPLVKEDKVYSVFPTDSWQENALKAVKLGNSLVVEGPPGTGKSQLICNLVSDAIANNKRVMVVSQKRAALDVVYKRLASKNLGEYCCLVHDFKNDRKEIFEKLSRQINRTDEYKSKNINLDAIQLDRAFFQSSHQIDHLTEELEHFRSTLFDESECGASIKELYLQSSPAQPFISIKQEYPHFKFGELDDFLRKMKLYVQFAAALDDDSHPWRRRKSFARLMPSELSRIEKTIDDVFAFTSGAMEHSKIEFGSPSDWDELVSLVKNQSEIEIVSQLIKSEELLTYLRKVLQAPQEVSSLWLSNIERMVMDCYGGDGPEASIPADQLGNFQKALYRSMKARKSLWGLIGWQFSKDKVLITRTLVANKLTSDRHGFRQLETKLDSRLNLEHNFSKLKRAMWIQAAPETLELAAVKAWFLKRQTAIKSAQVYNSIRAFRKLVDPLKVDFQKFSDQIQNLLAWLPSILTKINEWQNYLTPLQISELSHEEELKLKLIQSLKKDFDTLCDFDLQEESLTLPEKLIIEKLYEEIKSWDGDKFKEVFLNSLRLAWIDHIELKHPELRIVSSGKIKSVEEELRHHIHTKESLSAEILLLRARERITDNLEFNRLNNQITYRDLLHQVTKKKKIWPLRKVLTEFEDEVFKLAPCWLASPESVSALFPMREIFDLVIFDEASQCFAERGVPALYRGKQAVIAGDSKQLRPGDFYLARWQEDDFDEPDAEVDSLLDLAGRYLMKVQLNQHYRSRNWQLIQFSNHHFYEDRLQVLPHFDFIKENFSAIEYLKVDGYWENNCNTEEAKAVINKVKEILETTPEKEIGIVTFNAQQQYLIRDLMDSEITDSKRETIFVKNIENVQGDERDIIIFSIGYAPDKKGKMNAQFGSLNQDGGENRLNVAVTRAKEKVIVVSSILPHQLQVEETKNRGPKFLKEYLLYALAISNGEKRNAPHEKNTSTRKADLKNRINTENSNPAISFACDYPFADALVYKNEKVVGALLTDDNNYFQSFSCKAEHAHLPNLMDERKWPHLRVYSRNFWLDQKRFFSDMENSL